MSRRKPTSLENAAEMLRAYSAFRGGRTKVELARIVDRGVRVVRFLKFTTTGRSDWRYT